MNQAIPQVGALPAFTAPRFERLRTSTGIEVLYVHKPALPIVDVHLLVRGGAMTDRRAHAGRSSMAAELIDEGTRTRSALEISEFVEQLGAELDVRAGWDACFFTMHGLSSAFGDLMGLLCELVAEPSFPEDEFRRKRDERLHKLMQEQDEPRTIAYKLLARTTFGDQHPFGVPLAGTLASIEALGLAELRNYYDHTFAPARMHAVVVGDISREQVLAALDDGLGDWPGGAGNAGAESLEATTSAGLHLVHRVNAPQSEVRFGHVGVARGTADYFPILVMNTILGGSFKSRLNMKLREEKGFTYGASTGFSFRREGGSFSGGAAVDTEATAETVELSVAELVRMREGGVTAEELSRARNYLALGFMRNFETTGDIAGHLSELALYDLNDDHLAEYADRVAAVTADEVGAAAQRYLHPDQLSIVIVGDRERVLAPLSALGMGSVREWEAE